MLLNWNDFLLKSAIFPILFSIFSPLYAFLFSVITLFTYRYVIALIYGVKAMPALDIATFLGTEESRPNVMTAILFERLPYEQFHSKFKSLMS